MKRAPLLFISYRRSETQSTALGLARALWDRFGKGCVFIDSRSLPPDEPWQLVIREHLDRATVVFCVIGHGWLDARDEAGRLRLHQAEDWVRREVATALESEAKVMPIYVDGAASLRSGHVEGIAGIERLASLPGLPLRELEWDRDLSDIVDYLVGRGFPLIHRGAAAEPAQASMQLQPPPSNIRTPRLRVFVGRDLLLDEIEKALGSPGVHAGTLVLTGRSGVGKSALALEYAQRNLSSYLGGSFIIPMRTGRPTSELADIGSAYLDLISSDELSLEERAYSAQRRLSQLASLIIFDDVPDPEAVLPWLPHPSSRCHVLITTTYRDWEKNLWRCVEIPSLSEGDSIELVRQTTDEDTARYHGDALFAASAGVPMQLLPAASALVDGPVGERLSAKLEPGMSGSLGYVWSRLSQCTQDLLAAAVQHDSERILDAMLLDVMTDGLGCSADEVWEALRQSRRYYMLEGSQTRRMHQLVRQFVCGEVLADASWEGHARLGRVRKLQMQHLLRAAWSVCDFPQDDERRCQLMAWETDPAAWGGELDSLAAEDILTIAKALCECEQFSRAAEWYKLATLRELNEIFGPSYDGAVVAAGFYGAGFCCWREKSYDQALDWYGRAFREATREDGVLDRVTASRAARGVGDCHYARKAYTDAARWFMRAATEAERATLSRGADYEMLGSHLHCVGMCQFEIGNYEKAFESFETAVSYKRKGDSLGRMNAASIGRTLSSTAATLFRMGRHEEAVSYYEDALRALETGDEAGRVDHEGIASSMLEAAQYFSTGDGSAEPWYQWALQASMQGDAHGQVNGGLLLRSLDGLGECLAGRGKSEVSARCRAVVSRLRWADGQLLFLDQEASAVIREALRQAAASSGES